MLIARGGSKAVTSITSVASRPNILRVSRKRVPRRTGPSVNTSSFVIAGMLLGASRRLEATAKTRWIGARTCFSRVIWAMGSLGALVGDLDHLRVDLADRQIVDLEAHLVGRDEAVGVLHHLVVLAR